MRRKQCLDWRALALLGALLAILIDWQMVYAMPMILTTLRAVTTTTTTSEAETTTRLPLYQTTTMSTSLQEESLNHLNFKLFNQHDDDSDNSDDAYESEQTAVNNKQEFVENTSDSHSTNTDNNNSYSDNNDKNEYNSGSSIYKENQVYEIKNSSYFNNIKSNITDKFVNNNSNVSKINNQSSSDHHTQLTVSSSGDEIYKIQGIKKSNQISGRRKRKRIFINNSNANTSHVNITNNVNDENFLSSISKSVNKSVNIKENHSNARTFITTTTVLPTTKASHIKTTTTIDDDLSTNSSITTSKPFSSSSQSSLLHHAFPNVAILSRTERSIRGGSDVVDLLRNRNSGGIVRRSSIDILAHSSSNHQHHHQSGAGGSLKTRRLNNSRNTTINNSNSHYHSHNSYNYNNNNHNKSNLDRNERSTISLLSGPSRKIQLYIKNRFIQLLPDGTVNGTQDDQSEYTILQRSTVDVGRIKIQSVATCLYLCMDQCGAVFGSKDFTDDCVFNENMEQHNYNTYSSTFNSNSRRIYFLALNRHGEPRKLQIPPTRSLGKLATYTNAITETVPQERVEQLIAKNFGANRIKHGLRQLCDTGKPLIELIDSRNFKARPQCNPNSSNSNNSNSNSSSNSKTSSSSNSISSISSSSITSSSSISHSNSSSSSSRNNSNAQLLNNVPAANDKARISNAYTNSSNSSQSSSSNNEHTSGNSSGSNSGGNMKKKKKRRKCRPHENEEEHNCLPRPQALRKRGNNNKLKCQQQQQQQANVDGATPMPCTMKHNGHKKNNNIKKSAHSGGGRHNKKNPLVAVDGVVVPNGRKGKKLQGNVRPNANKNGANRKRGGLKRQNGQKAQNKKTQMSKMSTSTTTYRSNPTTSVHNLLHSETTTALPDRITTSIYDSITPDGQTTSDRGEREQRNARYSNSMEETEAGAGVETDDSVADSAENSEDDDDVTDSSEVAADDDTNDSYEDDGTVPNNVHVPTHLTSGSEDFLYDDQLDFLPISLWELFVLLWIMLCCFRVWI